MKRLLCVLCVLSALTAQAQKTADEWINTFKQRITLSGYAQGGFDYFDQSEPRDQFKIARLFLMADGQVTDHIRAYAMFDAKTATLHELWFNYKFNDHVNVKVGQFKTLFSLENPMSPTVLELIDPMSLVSAHMIAGGDVLMMKGRAGRDVGLAVYGGLLNGLLDYDLSLMNGNGMNVNDNNSQKDFVGRLRVHATDWLTVSGSVLTGTGNISVRQDAYGHYVSDEAAIGGLKSNGNFRRNRYAAGFEMKTDPVNLRSEYMAGKDGNSHSKGVYATGTVNNIGIKHLDLIASYDWLDAYYGMKRRYSGGLQYWFYPQCRLQLGYGYTKLNGATGENSIRAQLQVRF